MVGAEVIEIMPGRGLPSRSWCRPGRRLAEVGAAPPGSGVQRDQAGIQRSPDDPRGAGWVAVAFGTA
jgi:hypothetical protein